MNTSAASPSPLGAAGGAPGGAAFGRKASQTFRTRARAPRETDSQSVLVTARGRASRQGSSQGCLASTLAPPGAPFSLQRETENGTGSSAPSGEADVVARVHGYTGCIFDQPRRGVHLIRGNRIELARVSQRRRQRFWILKSAFARMSRAQFKKPSGRSHRDQATRI